MEGRQAKKTRNPIPDLQSNLVEPRKGEGFVFFSRFSNHPRIQKKNKGKKKRNQQKTNGTGGEAAAAGWPKRRRRKKKEKKKLGKKN